MRWTQCNSRRWSSWEFVWEAKRESGAWRDVCRFNRRGAMSLLSWLAIICLWHNHSVLITGPHLPPPTLPWSIDHRVTRESFVTPSIDFQCDWKKNQALLDGFQGLSGPWPCSCFPFGYTFPTPSHRLPDTLCSSRLEYQNLYTCWLSFPDCSSSLSLYGYLPIPTLNPYPELPSQIASVNLCVVPWGRPRCVRETKWTNEWDMSADACMSEIPDNSAEFIN